MGGGGASEIFFEVFVRAYAQNIYRAGAVLTPFHHPLYRRPPKECKCIHSYLAGSVSRVSQNRLSASISRLICLLYSLF